MFGKPTVDKIRIIISDGVSQEIQQLDNDIALLLPKVLRVSCGWHIVYMGWKAHIPTVNMIPKNNMKNYMEISSVLKNWMYSWMKSSCETKKEYFFLNNYSLHTSTHIANQCLVYHSLKHYLCGIVIV